VLVVASASSGQHAVPGVGVLAVPAAARRMSGLVLGVPVVLAACPAQGVLVVHPAETVLRLLTHHHARLAAVEHG